MVRRLLLWFLPFGSSSRGGRLDKGGTDTKSNTVEQYTSSVLEYKPPLQPLRRVKGGGKAEGCALVPRSRRFWDRERRRCTSKLLKDCVDQGKGECAIKCKKLCRAILKREDVKARQRGLVSMLFGRAQQQQNEEELQQTQRVCEDRLFGACKKDLEVACSRKASTFCDKAFDPLVYVGT